VLMCIFVLLFVVLKVEAGVLNKNKEYVRYRDVCDTSLSIYTGSICIAGQHNVLLPFIVCGVWYNDVVDACAPFYTAFSKF
jgi:hypothetical protein